MPAAALIDTGPIVASLIANEPSHAACLEALGQIQLAYTCWPVITEAVYLLGDYSPAVQKLFELLRDRTWEVLPIYRSDLDGIEAILSKYADQGFQLADACLMHLAEREGVSQVVTLDRKDFGVFRLTSGQQLTLLP
jgi:predicted nucleic acid-binding protein